MDIEPPYLGLASDSDEEEEEIFMRLCKDEADENASNCETSSSSSSSSSSSECEPEEFYDSRNFVEKLAMNPCVSKYEMANLVTAPRVTKQTRPISYASPPTKLVIAEGVDAITEDDRKRRMVYISTQTTSVYVMVENYVNVFYLCNRHTGENLCLCLRKVAAELLPYGVSYSKSKFTKVTRKNLDGPSNYIFGSGVGVESGTYSDAIGYKTHYNLMCSLEAAGFTNIAVKKRGCQNIVAKGTLLFKIRLKLLKHKYSNYVEYDSEDFAGAIIRVNKIDADLRVSRPNYRVRVCHSSSSDSNSEEHDLYGSSSSSSSSSCSSDDSDYDDDSQNRDSSSDSYEYFEETEYEKKTCHERFDYKKLTDKETRRKNRALLKAKEQAGNCRGLDKKPVKQQQQQQRDLALLQNPDELNDDHVRNLTRKKNVTILVFPKGRIICAGCKSDKEVFKTYAKVIDMIKSCEDNEENRAIEDTLVTI